MDIYFFSGLGADKRIFSKLKLPEKFHIHHIDWIVPVKKESLATYAERISSNIDSSNPVVLVGLSFGGIIAVEIAKLIKPKQVILISSVSQRQQIPWYYRLAGALRLPVLIPTAVLKSANPVLFKLFGALGKEQQQLLRMILKDTDPQFLKWAIRMLPNWGNKIKIPDLVQIHGTADHLLPLKPDQADIWVQNGGHLMVYNKHQELSNIITSVIHG